MSIINFENNLTDVIGVYLNGTLLDVQGIKLNGEIVWEKSSSPISIDIVYDYVLKQETVTNEFGYIEENDDALKFDVTDITDNWDNVINHWWDQGGEPNNPFYLSLVNWRGAPYGDYEGSYKHFSSPDIAYYYDKNNNVLISPSDISSYYIGGSTDKVIFEAVYQYPFFEIEWLGCESEVREGDSMGSEVWHLGPEGDGLATDIALSESPMWASSFLSSVGVTFPTVASLWSGTYEQDSYTLADIADWREHRDGLEVNLYSLGGSDELYPYDENILNGSSPNLLAESVFFSDITDGYGGMISFGSIGEEGLRLQDTDPDSMYWFTDPRQGDRTASSFFWGIFPPNPSFGEADRDVLVLMQESLYYAVALPHFTDGNQAAIYFIKGAELLNKFHDQMRGAQMLICDARDGRVFMAPILGFYYFADGSDYLSGALGDSYEAPSFGENIEPCIMPRSTTDAPNAFWVNLCACYANWLEREAFTENCPTPYYIYCTDGFGSLAATRIGDNDKCSYNLPKWVGMFEGVEIWAPDAPPVEEKVEWILTAPNDLRTGDIIVIATTDNYAMANDNGTTASPEAVFLSGVNTEGNLITSEVPERLQWYVVQNIDTDIMNFYKVPENKSDFALYSNNTNNGVRVGKGVNNNWQIDNESSTTDSIILYNVEFERYLQSYNNSDFRARTTASSSTGYNPYLKFYKKVINS